MDVLQFSENNDLNVWHSIDVEGAWLRGLPTCTYQVAICLWPWRSLPRLAPGLPRVVASFEGWGVRPWRNAIWHGCYNIEPPDFDILLVHHCNASLFSSSKSKFKRKASSFNDCSYCSVISIGIPISIWTTASEPKANVKGVSLVEPSGVVWFDHNTSGRSSAHVPFRASTLSFKPRFIILWMLSTWPLAYECAMDELKCLIPRCKKKSLNLALSNCLPLSVTIVIGIPNKFADYVSPDKVCNLFLSNIS